MDFRDKKVLVTGASSGIGAATSRALAEKGAEVLLSSRRKAALEEVAEDVTARGGKVRVHPADLGDSGEVGELARAVKAEGGAPDVVINNAGSGRWRFVDETSPEEARAMMEVPYLAAFNVTRAFLPEMVQRDRGHIVNISSVASRFVWPGATAFIAARWAIRGFTEALRADLDGTGIGVSLYESATVRSPYWEHNPGSYERVPKARALFPELTPEQAAAAILKGIRRNRKLIVAPFVTRAIYWQRAVLPGVVQWMATKTGYRLVDRGKPAA